jgi:hypothetical protein
MQCWIAHLKVVLLKQGSSSTAGSHRQAPQGFTHFSPYSLRTVVYLPAWDGCNPPPVCTSNNNHCVDNRLTGANVLFLKANHCCSHLLPQCLQASLPLPVGFFLLCPLPLICLPSIQLRPLVLCLQHHHHNQVASYQDQTRWLDVYIYSLFAVRCGVYRTRTVHEDSQHGDTCRH